MKKVILGIFALMALVFANEADYKQKLSKLVSDKIKRNIEIKKVLDLEGSKDLKVAILYDAKEKTEIAVLATKDANIMVGLSNIFLSSNEKDLIILNQAYQETQPKIDPPKPEALDKFFSSLSDDRLISLKSGLKNAKQTFYLVLDPRCPSCNKELSEIPQKLKEGNVKMLLVSFLGQESAYKAQLIYSKMASLKSNEEKLKLMQEVFSPDYQLKPADKKQDISKIQKNSEDVVRAGIQSVPFEHIIKK